MRWLLVAVLLAGCGAVEPSPPLETTPASAPHESRVLTAEERRLWLAEGEYYRALCAPLIPVLDDSEQGYYCTADPLTPTEPPS